MKRKILIVIYIILTLITIKLLYNIVVNGILIQNYENGKYSENTAKALLYINFPQSYVANYNYGNILYQNGKYESSIEEYKKALEKFVPEYKRCSIRINYALAICKTVQVNEKDQDSIQDAIKTYNSAIHILTEEGCANTTDNNGHSAKAEQLKKDIQKEINRLKKLQNSEDNSKEDSNNENNEDKTQKEVESIETQIQEIKEDATMQQREKESQYVDFSKGVNFKGKNW